MQPSGQILSEQIHMLDDYKGDIEHHHCPSKLPYVTSQCVPPPHPTI